MDKHSEGGWTYKTADILVKPLITSVLHYTEDKRRLLEIFQDPNAIGEREIITEAITIEMVKNDEQNRLAIFDDEALTEDFEKILINDPDNLLSEERVNELLNIGTIRYKSEIKDNKVVKRMEIDSISQIIALEIENIISKRNPDIVYRRCKYCKNIFIANRHAGNQDMLCSYNYSDGLCKKLRQKSLDDGKSGYEKVDKKIDETMRKKQHSEGYELSEYHIWRKEFMSFVDPLKNVVPLNEYEGMAKKKWTELRKRINEKKKKS